MSETQIPLPVDFGYTSKQAGPSPDLISIKIIEQGAIQLSICKSKGNRYNDNITRHVATAFLDREAIKHFKKILEDCT